jgi:hypothetical protein
LPLGRGQGGEHLGQYPVGLLQRSAGQHDQFEKRPRRRQRIKKPVREVE